MKVVTDLRTSTPVQAVVGVTDLAVGALRTAQADLTSRATKAQDKALAGAAALRAELSPAKLQSDVANLPTVALTKSIEVAGKAEETYSDLAARGRSLVTSIRRRSATKDLLAQSKSTLTLGKAAVTTVRQAGDDTLEAAKATLTAGRREVANVTRASKAVSTSARKTAVAAGSAAESAAQATGTPRTAPARKTTARKTTARKTTARTATGGTTAARKSTASKTTARKTAARKTAARKTAARKTTARKTTAG